MARPKIRSQGSPFRKRRPRRHQKIRPPRQGKTISPGYGYSTEGYWWIDCGGGSGTDIDCETGNNAGYEDGGQLGETGCTTQDMGCNIIA